MTVLPPFLNLNYLTILIIIIWYYLNSRAYLKGLRNRIYYLKMRLVLAKTRLCYSQIIGSFASKFSPSPAQGSLLTPFLSTLAVATPGSHRPVGPARPSRNSFGSSRKAGCGEPSDQRGSKS